MAARISLDHQAQAAPTPTNQKELCRLPDGD